jgi:hypothetical protein
MIPSSIDFIDGIVITVEPITLMEADIKAIQTALSSPSVVKYLNHLKCGLYQDHANIDLKTYSENRDLYAMQQVFVKGGINVIETLLQIHKNQPTSNPNAVTGATNAAGNTNRNT